MQKKLLCILAILSVKVFSQELPVKVTVPAPHTDPNLQLNILNFEASSNDQFSVLYQQVIYGSIMRAGEFVSDTGGIVYSDSKWNQPVYGSNSALFVIKQVVDASGKVVSTRELVLAQRALDSQTPYRLYFPKRFRHPMVGNRSPVAYSIYTAQNLEGFSESEMAALLKLCKTFLPPEKNTAQVDGPVQENSSIAKDVQSIKKQFKELRSAGLMFRGDLPKDEKVLTRFEIVPERVFVVTRTKGDKALLKFYLTPDYKTYEQLDTAGINGDVTLTSAATVYNLESQAVGAFVNLHYKFKDEKGEDVSRQYSFAMDPDYRITGWMHSVGKDKLNSLSPEYCWYEGDKLFVMSNNREKFFKSYMQVHEFAKGAPAKMLYPLTEEEKGSEKTKFAKTFQPEVPFNQSQVTPIPERYIPLRSVSVGNTRYFLTQGVKYSDALKGLEYLSLNVYRMEGGKVTGVEILGDYRANVPFAIEQITSTAARAYFLLPYPNKVLMTLTAEKMELSPVTDASSSLYQKDDRSYVQRNDAGSVLLHQQPMGNKKTLLFFPAGK